MKRKKIFFFSIHIILTSFFLKIIVISNNNNNNNNKLYIQNMGRVQKKNAKGRLDKYYYLAKEKGYRARSSFKILQINEKYGHFLEKSKVIIDLCAAPGSWCQVASQLCPVNSLIIGVDIVPMKSMPNVITFQSDITTEDCRSKLAGYMKTWKADTVMHDGAPNVGLNWVQDAYTQSQLTLQALKLAVEHLNVGGIFITKVFRSKDYNNLMWVFNQLFEKVEATKPPASRNVSAEIFVVCKNFKAPKKLDPRFLDPKYVFEEVEENKINNEAKVFNPELKRRQRQGYEEGDYTLFHPMNLLDWVKQEDDIISTLGSINKFEILIDDPEWKILKRMKQTTNEFLECCKDLKVLGKKDFKLLLKWRKHARNELGILDPKDIKLQQDKDKIEIEELNEDERIDKELDEVKERLRLKNKREKRRSNLQKQKEIQRMQMNMLTDMQIGIDAANIGSETLFNLKTAEKTGELNNLAKGKKTIIFNNDRNQMNNETDMYLDENFKSHQLIDKDNEVDNLEDELNNMYSSYKDRKKERDAKLRAKEARGDNDDDAWEGIKEEEDLDNQSSDYEEEEDSEDSEEEDSEDDEAISNLIATIERKKKNSLSSKASNFFNDSIFQDVDLNIASNNKGDTKILKVNTKSNNISNKLNTKEDEKMDDIYSSDEEENNNNNDNDDEGFEIVPNEYNNGKDEDMDDFDTDSEDELNEKARESHKLDIDIATAQAMTMAHDLALGKKSKKDLVNDGFNKYSFRDKEGLPEWFIEEEDQHSKINRPITKEAALAIKEKMKQLNARPIKKVLEAQGRKKMRALKRLDKLKRKSDGIMDDESKSEADKAAEIQALMGKMTKKQKTKPKVTLVVARNANKRLAGRPKGVKGKYKMVDGVLKNEMRALRRIAKKHKKK
jgi:AdoMet-dependent rRNA methyltransferase SPB1